MGVCLSGGDSDTTRKSAKTTISTRALLSAASTTLASAFEQGSLATDSLLGAGNLSYKLSLLRDALCMSHAFLDDDRARRSAIEKARNDGLLAMSDVTLSTVPGSPDAEIEDLLDPASYVQTVRSRFGVDLSRGPFRGNKKLSDRVRATLVGAGKPWDSRVETEVKMAVAVAVAASPQGSLCEPNEAASMLSLSSSSTNCRRSSLPDWRYGRVGSRMLACLRIQRVNWSREGHR